MIGAVETRGEARARLNTEATLAAAGKATTRDVIEALERRYNNPSKPREWATFTELSDAQGHRRVDWLASALWVSRSRIMHGIEIKVQRADWKRELASPKADAWFSVVDRWYLAAPVGVLLPGELPTGWGYYELRSVPTGWALKEVVKAPVLDRPQDTPWWLVQRMLNRVEDRRKATDPELEAVRSKTYEQAYAAGKQSGQMLRSDDRSARQELSDLLNALGGPDFAWKSEPRRIELVKRAITLMDNGPMDNLARRSAELFREAADAIDKALTNGYQEPDGERDAIQF